MKIFTLDYEQFLYAGISSLTTH